MEFSREQPFPEDFWATSATSENTSIVVPLPGSTPPHSPHRTESGHDTSIDDDFSWHFPKPEERAHLQEPLTNRFLNDLPTGTGLGPEAHIWPIYNEHAEKYDKEMLETYNGGMDNLLIFAALFSAVVSAFIVLSVPLLQADPMQPVVDVLSVISLQLSISSSGNISIPSGSYQAEPFSPTASVVSINALWIMSLSVSLSTSVLAMLVKQWLRVYGTNLPTPQKEKAKERQARYDGLVSWQVAGLANSLPVLIHLAVALFLVGLVMYLWDISLVLRYIVLVFVVLGGVGYMALATAPLIWPRCPYKSPVTQGLSLVTTRLETVWHQLQVWIPSLTKHTRTKNGREKERGDFEDCPLARSNEMELDAQSMTWLVQTSSDMGVAKAVVAACVSWQEELIPNASYRHFKEHMHHVLGALPHVTILLQPPEGFDPTTISWKQLNGMLTEALISRSALLWSEPWLDDSSSLDWAWSYPVGQVPEEDQLWFYAVLCYLTGGNLAGREHYKGYDAALELLISTLDSGSADISLSACVFFLKRLGNRSIPPRLEEAVLRFIGASTVLPVQFLCFCRHIWAPHEPGEASFDSNGRQFSSMDDFFMPFIENTWRWEICTAAMKLLTNGLKAEILSSPDIRLCLSSLLRYFRGQGCLYPQKPLPLAEPRVVERMFPTEIELLKECLRSHARLPLMLMPQELLEVAQLCDTSMVLSLPHVLQPLLAEDLRNWLLQVEDLCRAGRIVGQKRLLLIATFALSAMEGDILRRLKWGEDPSLLLPVADAFAAWLAWLSDPGMLELHLRSHERRRALIWALDHAREGAREVLRKSRVMEAIMNWDRKGSAFESLTEDPLFPCFFRMNDSIFDPSIDDEPGEVLGSGDHSVADPRQCHLLTELFTVCLHWKRWCSALFTASPHRSRQNPVLAPRESSELELGWVSLPAQVISEVSQDPGVPLSEMGGGEDSPNIGQREESMGAEQGERQSSGTGREEKAND